MEGYLDMRSRLNCYSPAPVLPYSSWQDWPLLSTVIECIIRVREP